MHFHPRGGRSFPCFITLDAASRCDRWTTSPEMATQTPEHKHWHSNIGLDEFVGHVLKFKSLVDSTQTRELGTIDKEQLKKMMGWGLFIEQVREPLSPPGETFCCENVSTSSFLRVLLRCDPALISRHRCISMGFFRLRPYKNVRQFELVQHDRKRLPRRSGVL